MISQTLSSLRMSPIPGPDTIRSISLSIRSRTISSAALSEASKRQCVMAEERSCMARGRRGELWLMMWYERNFVMALRAREVMAAEVDEERMTCRNG